jgi:CTP:molybdopterin cytidylyltransferase MocA
MREQPHVPKLVLAELPSEKPSPPLRRKADVLRIGAPSRSHDAVIRVYDEAGNVIEAHEHKGDHQPAVDAQAIVRLIRLRKTTKKEIIASSYANTLGVPALFARSFFCELLSLGDRAGAKSIILRNRERVVQVPFPEGKIDIDSWSDYEILRSGVRSRAGDRSWAAEESPE